MTKKRSGFPIPEPPLHIKNRSAYRYQPKIKQKGNVDVDKEDLDRVIRISAQVETYMVTKTFNYLRKRLNVLGEATSGSTGNRTRIHIEGRLKKKDSLSKLSDYLFANVHVSKFYVYQTIWGGPSIWTNL